MRFWKLAEPGFLVSTFWAHLLGMDLSKEIAEVQKLAKADNTGNGQPHVDLLESIRKLTLAAETPAETLMRMRFEVRAILLYS